ncbi:MAG: transcriptional repressor [Helicobacter sp.]|uniref:ferric iron uptake transcriptional regulator n=1 Tax=Helicobacter sp. TaxID=218 RepID=UPI0025C36362|nr:Fur family transcriptional regulator [Helicobacter sp.]MCH5313307.1 transcriptional repressor [Helicobacter sp.]
MNINANHRVETLESILERLRMSIKKYGLKNSKQREEIIAVLYKSGTHLSPDEITNIIKESDKNASISSVYRILSFLEKEHFITALESDKSGRRYEIAAKEHHDHIICLSCGDIVEFVDSDIERLQLDVAKQFGAQLISHDMRLFVRCSKCQGL